LTTLSFEEGIGYLLSFKCLAARECGPFSGTDPLFLQLRSACRAAIRDWFHTRAGGG